MSEIISFSSLDEFGTAVKATTGKVYLYCANDICVDVRRKLSTFNVSPAGTFDSYKVGPGIGTLEQCLSEVGNGDALIICSSKADLIGKSLSEKGLSRSVCLYDGYNLFTHPSMRHVSSYTNLPDDIDLYVSGTDEQSATLYIALLSAGRENVKGFIANQSDNSFMGLPVSSPQEMDEHDLRSSAIFLKSYDDPMLFFFADHPNAFVGDWLYAFQMHPEFMQEKAFVAQYGRGSRCAFDVGCNLGIMSLMMLEFADRVVGFEPNNLLHAELGLNMAGRENFRLEDLALGREKGTADLFVDQKTTGGSSLNYNPNYHDPAQTLSVQIDTLDEFCLRYEIIPEFIKIDAEGHDGNVILGGSRIIETHRPPILFEMAYNSWCTVEEAFAFLRPMYDFIDLQTGLRIDVEICKTLAKEMMYLNIKHTNVGCVPR